MDVLSIKFLSAAFIFFSAGMSLLFSIGQLCGRVRYFENYVLSSYLFCLSVIFFQTGLIVNEIYLTHPRLLYFHLTALYFMAPIIYCADYLVILPVETMTKKLIFLFVPVIIGLSADIYFMAMPDADKIVLLKDLFGGAFTDHAIAAKAVITGAGIQMWVYLAFLLKKLFGSRDKGDNMVIFYLIILSIFIIAGLSVIIILGYLFGSYTLLRWWTNLTGLLLVCAYISSQRYPKIWQLLMYEAEKKYAGRSLLDQVDVSTLIGKLTRLMEHDRLYADDQLTLHDVADELSITPHQLSQLLNDRLNTNFNTFINQYRINEAKEMLLNSPHKTVLAISLEVGFNSKSAFYEAFSRFTGMSPQNFRKRSNTK
jgi:AraC-like DNA-binding protein